MINPIVLIISLLFGIPMGVLFGVTLHVCTLGLFPLEIAIVLCVIGCIGKFLEGESPLE